MLLLTLMYVDLLWNLKLMLVFISDWKIGGLKTPQNQTKTTNKLTNKQKSNNNKNKQTNKQTNKQHRSKATNEKTANKERRRIMFLLSRGLPPLPP